MIMVIINATDVLVQFCPIHKTFGGHFAKDSIFCPGFTNTLEEVLEILIKMITKQTCDCEEDVSPTWVCKNCLTDIKNE